MLYSHIYLSGVMADLAFDRVFSEATWFLQAMLIRAKISLSISA